MKGKLYIIATPIGNLSDITFRAVETLKSVPFILCEDTRETSKLTKHYDIISTLISYRDQNHERIIKKIKEKLDLGLSLALVSDAGTPTISDPGYKLISELKSLDYYIIPIPGPDATTSSLCVSGLPTDKYVFLGFLPKSESKRIEMIKEYGNIECTVCIYESPNRVNELIDQIISAVGNRTISLCNDLTKMYERVETGKVLDLKTTSKLLQNPKGEFVVLIAKE